MDAVLAVKSLREDRLAGIDIVQDVVRILLFSGGKDKNLVDIGQLFEAINHVGPKAHLDLAVLERELERWLELSWDTSFELGSNQGLVHVKDQRLWFLLFAELERLEHELVLVFVFLLVPAERVTIVKQLNKLQVDELRWVIDLLVHHGASVLFHLEHVIAITVISIVVDVLIHTGSLLFLVSRVLELLKLVANEAEVANALGLLDHW